MDKNPMFDFDNCEGVELTDNKTSSEKLVKATNTKNITASGNEAAISNSSESSPIAWHNRLWGKIIIGLSIGIVLLIIKLAIV